MSALRDKHVIRIVAVDDHPVFRAGLISLVANETDLRIVGEAKNGREAIEQYRELRPDIMLLDLQMPIMGGVEAIVAIREEFLSARIIVLTTFSGDVLARRALTAGAQGFILKGMIRKDLLDAIRAVHVGLKRVNADIAAQLANHVGEDSLSERETQVLQLVSAGFSNKRVAAALGISEETAKGHVKSILAKLNATDRTHAVTRGLARGIIELLN
jgi:DNA-binding NarL/FixJ family response regulator